MYHLRRKVHFVIMVSVFDTPAVINTIYDLKGSTIGRSATPKERSSGGVLKDNDLLADGAKLHLGVKKTPFLQQLERDASFLSSLNIMDYSLLVGIHDRKSRPQSNKAHSPSHVTTPVIESVSPVDKLRESPSDLSIDSSIPFSANMKLHRSNTPFRKNLFQTQPLVDPTISLSTVPENSAEVESPRNITIPDDVSNTSHPPRRPMRRDSKRGSKNSKRLFKSDVNVDNAAAADVSDVDVTLNSDPNDYSDDEEGDDEDVDDADDEEEEEEEFLDIDEGDSLPGDGDHLIDPNQTRPMAADYREHSLPVVPQEAGLGALGQEGGKLSSLFKPSELLHSNEEGSGSDSSESSDDNEKDRTDERNPAPTGRGGGLTQSSSTRVFNNFMSSISHSLPFMGNHSGDSRGKSSIQGSGGTKTAASARTEISQNRAMTSNTLPIMVKSRSADDHRVSNNFSSGVPAQHMDYSAIQTYTYGPGITVHKPWTSRADGGINSRTKEGKQGDDIYYVGVIDILQQYNVSKKAETFFKVIYHSNLICHILCC